MPLKKYLLVVSFLCYLTYLIGITFTIGSAISSQWRNLILYSFPTLIFFLFFVFSGKFEKGYILVTMGSVVFMLPIILGNFSNNEVFRIFAQKYFIFYDRTDYKIPFSYLYFFQTLLVSLGISVILNSLIKSRKTYSSREVFSDTAGVFLLFYAVLIRYLGIIQSDDLKVSLLSMILWFLPLSFPLFRYLDTKKGNPLFAKFLKLEHWIFGIIGIGSFLSLVELFMSFRPVHPIALWVTYAFFTVCAGVIMGYKLGIQIREIHSVKMKAILKKPSFWLFIVLLTLWTTINWFLAHAAIHVWVYGSIHFG